ncbi:MAG: DUF3500 domain-containing protein [Planctomycetota bacterium]|nr:MAG: DUF3500 domain-containing protein [Planctomycetota bacterium]
MDRPRARSFFPSSPAASQVARHAPRFARRCCPTAVLLVLFAVFLIGPVAGPASAADLAESAASSKMEQIAAEEIATAASRFLASLDESQRTEAQFPFEAEARTAWHYFPTSMMASRGGRAGIAMKDLRDDQRALVQAVLGTTLSHHGILQASTIQALETVLRDLENGNPARDSGAYHIAVFGTPGTKATWGWSFEGHHLSINITLVDGTHFSTTPSFFGSNPAIVPEGPHQGLDVLHEEQALARRLVRSLTPAQRKKAIIADAAPRDIVTAADTQVAKDRFHPPQGIAFEDLDAQQQALLRRLAAQFTRKYRRPIVAQLERRSSLIPGRGSYFAWAGGMEPGQGHYWRIQTPDYAFEYDNTQNKANHIHTVWRSFADDFGRDLLREHYEHADHHHP